MTTKLSEIGKEELSDHLIDLVMQMSLPMLYLLHKKLTLWSQPLTRKQSRAKKKIIGGKQ